MTLLILSVALSVFAVCLALANSHNIEDFIAHCCNIAVVFIVFVIFTVCGLLAAYAIDSVVETLFL